MNKDKMGGIFGWSLPYKIPLDKGSATGRSAAFARAALSSG